MRTPRVSRGFRCTIPELIGAAKIIAEGLADPEAGARVGERLPPNCNADLRASIAGVESLAAGQKSAMGDYHRLTEQKGAAEVALEDLMSLARRSARIAHRKTPALLHEEYAVGRQYAQGTDAVIVRGMKIVAACEKYADIMAAHAWNARATAALRTAVEALQEAEIDRLAARSEQLRATAGLIIAANELYCACLLVQIAARMEFNARDIATDPSIVEARDRFLLGKFPLKRRQTADEGAGTKD